MHRFTSSAIVFGLVMTQTVYAATQIDLVTNENGTVSNQSAIIANGKVSVRHALDPTVELLYERSLASIFVINHAQKSYMTLDEASLDQLGGQVAGFMNSVQQQIAGQLENMAPEQRAQMESIMQSMGLGGLAETPPVPTSIKISFTGQNTEIAGVRCRLATISEGNQKTAEMCVAAPGKLGIDAADYATLESLFSFGEALARKAAPLLSGLGVQIPPIRTEQIDGVPVAAADLRSNVRVVVNSIKPLKAEHEIPGIPPDYTKTALPGFGS